MATRASRAAAATRRHPETGEMLHRRKRRLTVQYKGRKRRVEVEGWFPKDAKRDGVLVGKDMAPMDAALDDLKAEAARDMSRKIRKLREKAGLSQRRASQLLGGGPRAFQKYETGQVAPSTAVINLLTLIANDPSRLDELKRG